ncbi:sigma factor-like helix-turn-helix DNA-binding protein [Dyadobacter psychrotolerans]|uniref:sigma factor-like helix-turn-helix DNA-binding protein n=1 Tax=Dyadobacter psychrotolerans TaxID=2541721 RepID=UPI0014045C4D|nr:sigma factor-like helix-turn-helix DNA-binding protein [Dyadobacter psychrotolerans]
MKNLSFLVLVLLFSQVSAAAQYDSLVHKPYADRIEGYFHLYLELIDLKDSAAIASRAEKIKNFAREKQDPDLEMEMDLFLVYHDAFFKNLPESRAIAAIKNLILQSEKENIWHVNIRAVRVLALYYWEHQRYELAFEQYMVLDKKLSAHNVYDFPELVRDLLKIGEAYYYFHDYPQAKSYFQRIIRLPETDFNTMFMNSARNTLGLCYQKEKDYMRSDHYFNEILKTNFAVPKKIWRRIAVGNLGANCYYRQQYDKAVPMLEDDFQGATRESDFGPAAGAAILLADIFLIKGNAERSWTYIGHARSNIEKAGQRERLQFLYPIISKWYGYKNQTQLSKIYLDSTVSAINQYHYQFSATKVLRAQQKISFQQEELRRAEIVLENQKKANERVLMLIFFSAFVIIFILGYLIHKKRQQAKDLKIQVAMQELEVATQNLKQFTESISEKNHLIEQLQSRWSDEEKNELVNQLQQSTILTEEDWSAFQKMFDKVYPGFIFRAKKVYPDLSIAELRYFLLSKLNLSYKEMSAMLGVSPNTVQVLRHRIRKKLQFSNNEVMEEVINQI